MRSACARASARRAAVEPSVPPRVSSSRSCSKSATTIDLRSRQNLCRRTVVPAAFRHRIIVSGACYGAVRPGTLRAMRVGLSLLTLVPGLVGGSETYARELTPRARTGRRASTTGSSCPRSPRTPADGLPTRSCPSTARARSMPGRIAAMSLASLRPGRVRRRFDARRARRDPLPAQRDDPAASTARLRQRRPRPPARALSRVLLARGARATAALVYGWTVERSRIVIAISEHARQTLIERYKLDPERVRAIHLGIDHDRFTPRRRPREPFVLYPANRWPHKNHDRLFDSVRAA